MNERETRRRRSAFMEIIIRTWSFWPRAAVEEWGLGQHELVSKGSRNRFEVSDVALGAWARSDSTAGREREARSLWGRGWAQGAEVNER